METKRRKRIFRMVTALTAVAVLGCAVWIMARRMGLAPGYDFGAGAYYYADDPALQDLADRPAFITRVPKWIHYVFFFAWGALMWAVWNWLDKK